MKLKNALITFTSIAILAACGSATQTLIQGSTSSAPTNAGLKISTTADLQGTWTSDCVLDSTRAGIYIKEFLTYDDSSLRRDTTTYLDSHCQGSSAFFEQIVIADDQFSADGTYTETRKSLSVTPLTSTAAQLFMSSHYCGNQGRWNLSEERTFTDVKSCGLNSVQTILLQIRDDHGTRKMNAKQCEANHPSDCSEMTYTQS